MLYFCCVNHCKKSFPFFSLRPDGLQKNNLFLVLPAREPQYPILTISTGIIQSPAQIVNARAQAAQLQAVRHLLTQEELDIVQRARNAHIGHHAPQSATPEEYLTASGFEALMGYLFLTGQMNRAQMLFRLGRV